LPAHLEPTSAWREIRAELRRAVGEPMYEIWLERVEVESLQAGLLTLTAPPPTGGWVADRFGRILQSCAEAVLGHGARIAFTGNPGARAGTSTSSRGDDSLPQPAVASLNPRYIFDQFIIGDGNRFAHAASLAVAELPGQAYNPLFLHAPPGLGKTHLLHAIGNYMLAFGAGTTVRYTTVEAFTNAFITALSSRSIDHFKRAYRAADVLLIDDVQFLASKAKTEEEFFHTFNALYETGRELVLTCDRLPRQLVNVEERLRERFEAGLVADITPPDFATRVAILRKRAALDRVPLTDTDVLELVAERVTDNVRALEGALIRIVAYHSLTRRPIDVQLAAAVLDGIHPKAASAAPTIRDIQTVVAANYGISVAELTSASRATHIAWPRQVAMHLARQLTTDSLNTIGDAFGHRSHATALHACKRVSSRLSVDTEVGAQLSELAREIAHRHTDRSC
jgi:chromosomal replication initiator protein